MVDKKTNIKFTDDAIELGDVDTFIAREWSEKYGEKITELAEAASGGANDFVSKINSMGMSLEQLLGQNLSELISSDLFSADLSSRLSAASSAGASLSRLDNFLLRVLVYKIQRFHNIRPIFGGVFKQMIELKSCVTTFKILC